MRVNALFRRHGTMCYAFYTLMLLILFNHMFPALQYLPAIYQARGDEVEARLYP